MRGLDEKDVPLPRGTAVVLTAELRAADGSRAAKGCAARVDVGHHQTYEVLLPDGRRVVAARDQLAIQRREDAERLVGAALTGAELDASVVFRAVVGSVAWGLDDEGSDLDRRGVFLLPFDLHVGLRRVPDAIDPPGGDPLWEAEKHLQLLLKSDASALELLWSPQVLTCEPCYQPVLAHRADFATTAVLGAFGRYAQSQFAKIERRLKQAEMADLAAEQLRRGETLDLPPGEEKALLRALHSRGAIPERTVVALTAIIDERPGRELLGATWRPKNAYNLLRLLHSGTRLLRTGEPMIEVDDALRPRLLQVKRAEVPIEEVLAEARTLGQELEAAATDSVLPDAPPVALVDGLLRELRRHAARVSMATPAAAPEVVPIVPDVVVAEVRKAEGVLLLGLVGAHAYGFPSPDSDFDLKGIHVAPTDDFLGLDTPRQTADWTRVIDGVEIDWTTHEIAFTLRRLLAGDGTMLERFATPLQLLASPDVDALRALALATIGRHFVNHYRGFLRSRSKRLASEGATVKDLLYAYRVALTGAHLLRAGEAVLDVMPLAEDAGLGPEVAELVAIKRSGEKTPLPALPGPSVQERLAGLEARLTRALEASSLPENAPEQAVRALREWLVDRRRRQL